MYQIPAWRYWLVGIVMAVGLLLALPNFFGDEPAIQVVREDRATMDGGGEERIVGFLKAANVAYSNAYLEDGRLVVRFDDVDSQKRPQASTSSR
jgi:preprotein translocase subunit SecD